MVASTCPTLGIVATSVDTSGGDHEYGFSAVIDVMLATGVWESLKKQSPPRTFTTCVNDCLYACTSIRIRADAQPIIRSSSGSSWSPNAFTTVFASANETSRGKSAGSKTSNTSKSSPALEPVDVHVARYCPAVDSPVTS